MRLCVSGTICQGKSTLVKDFLKTWPDYKLGELSYRKVLKDKALPHSTQGTEETQKIIRDAIIDDICSYDRNDNVIFDRGLFDNLAYTLYLNEKGSVSDEFTSENVQIVREALSFYDIIFFVPMLDSYPVELEEDTTGIRDTNPVFREETDMIMKLIQQDYLKEAGKPRHFFPNENCPAILEIFGRPEERIQMIKLYLNEQGVPYDEKESLLTDVNGVPIGNGDHLHIPDHAIKAKTSL